LWLVEVVLVAAGVVVLPGVGHYPYPLASSVQVELVAVLAVTLVMVTLLLVVVLAQITPPF
jgi:hypothetical protein